MAEYTYEDIIINPKDSRVEIGAEYWFCDCPNDTIKRLNNAKAAKNGHLSSVKSNEGLPFYDEDSRCWLCIIRKKGLTYEERQAEWMKANNIKVGDKVKVIRKCESGENGWDDTWLRIMDIAVGKVLKIIGEPRTVGILLEVEGFSRGAYFPYFVLEKVEEPEFKVGDFVKEKETGMVGVITEKTEEEFAVYQNCPNAVLLFEAEELEPAKAHIKPFNLSDPRTRDKIRGCWIRKKDNSEIKLIWWLWESDGKWMIDEDINPQELLNDWVFEDGSPCGIVVEDEE